MSGETVTVNGSLPSGLLDALPIRNGKRGEGETALFQGNRHRKDLQLLERAARWDVNKATKDRLKARAEILAYADDERTSVAAIKALIAMDATDARREAIDSNEGIANQGAALTVLRELHRSSENRDLIAQLSDGTVHVDGSAALVAARDAGGDERVPPPPPTPFPPSSHEPSIIRSSDPRPPSPPTDVIEDVYLQISE